MVTVITALLSSMMMAGSCTGTWRSRQMRKRKMRSLTSVYMARVSECIEDVDTRDCFWLRLWNDPGVSEMPML